MDINTISSVNESNTFFRYSDGKQESRKTDIKALKEIYQDVCNETIFYYRMWLESSQEFDRNSKILNIMSCPSEEEIKNCGRNLNHYFDLQEQRENYLKLAHYNSGRHEICLYALSKYEKFSQLQREIKIVVNRGSVNKVA